MEGCCFYCFTYQIAMILFVCLSVIKGCEPLEDRYIYPFSSLYLQYGAKEFHTLKAYVPNKKSFIFVSNFTVVLTSCISYVIIIIIDRMTYFGRYWKVLCKIFTSIFICLLPQHFSIGNCIPILKMRKWKLKRSNLRSQNK